MLDLIVENWKVIYYIIPFFMTFLLYRIVYRRSFDEKKATLKSIAYSTIFYIIGVLNIIYGMFNNYFIGYILIIAIVILAIILINQWKNNNEVVLTKGLKSLWKLCFLFFFVSYLGLLLFKIGMFIYLEYIL